MSPDQSVLWSQMIDRTRRLVTFARGRLTSDIYIKTLNYEDERGRKLFCRDGLTEFGIEMMTGKLLSFALHFWNL